MMKTLLLITVFLMLTRLLLAPESKVFFIQQAEKIRKFEKLWLAICRVESGSNPLAYHIEWDGFAAVGICQIRHDRLKDYNSRTHHNYKMKDLYDPAVSKSIFIYYANQYSDFETISRLWNGGPKGMNYRQTKRYWLRVQVELNRINP